MQLPDERPRRMTHAEILRRAIGGDRTAEEILAERLLSVPRILASINARMGSPLSEHDLADLCQDTVVIVLRKLRRSTPIEELQGWIYRVCSFELMNAIRRKRRQPPLLREDAVTRDDDGLSYEPAPGWEFEDVDEGIRLLPAEEAIVVRLKFFGENTFDEIAGRLHRSQGTVKAQFYRGLMRLQAFLETRYPEAADARTPVR